MGMMNPLTIDAPWDGSLEFIQKQNPYDCSKGLDELLDLVRTIQESGNYYWQGLVFPDSTNLTIPAGGTFNGTLVVPEGTYVTGINYYAHGNAPDSGVRFRLYDKGTKASIFYGDYQLDSLVASDRDPVTVHSPVGSNNDMPMGTGYLLSPFIITKPGVLGWEIVNKNTLSTMVQFLVCCAVPITNKSIGGIIVNKE